MRYNYTKGELIKIEVSVLTHNTLSFTYSCPVCGSRSILILNVKNAITTLEQIREYNEDKRRIMAIEGLEDNPTAREALISGMCSCCQKEVFC